MSRMIGTRSNKLDAKGRVAVPAKWRDELGDEIVVTPGEEHCLNVYSAQKYNDLLDALDNAPFMSDDKVRQSKRKLLSESEDMVLDKQGRISLTIELRKHAGLFEEQDVLFKGVGDHLEIWKIETWEAYDEGFDLAEGGKSFAGMGL